jgi:HK97 family phage portal protein
MVKVIERVRGALRGFAQPNLSPIMPPDLGEKKEYPLPLIWHLVAPGKYNWALIDYEAYAKEGFSQNEVIYSAIKYKWDSVSQSPLRAYTGNQAKAKPIEDDNNPLVMLADRPNEYMGPIQFMQYCVLYLNLHGNCFVYFKNKAPYGLYPLRPDRVQIIPETKGGKKILGYLYYPDGMSIEHSFPIRKEEMLHVKLPNPYDPLEGLGYGLSPLSAAARSADIDNNMTKFLAEFFARNGIMGGGVIELPDAIDIDDINKLRQQFLEAYGGASQWGKPIVVDAGGTYKPLSMSFTDMALDNIDLRSIRRINAVFGVDPKLTGLDSASSTYNNMQEAENAFWTRVMITELRLFEEELRFKVKISPKEFLRFDVSGIPAFSEDTTAQVATYAQLVGNFVPPNEAAKIAGLDIQPMEGGDESYMPVGLTPVKIALNPPEPTAPSGSPFGGGAAEEEEKPNAEEAPKPKPETEEAAKAIDIALNQGRKIKRWNFEKKDNVAASQDRIAHKYEPKLEASALKRFQADKAETLRLFRKAQKSASKSRKAFDWNDFENSIRFYLFVQGQQEWSWEFGIWFAELAWDARDDWIERMALREIAPTINFDLIFLSRASIEGEAWFADYTLKFARAINMTTHEGIHAVIRDGLEQGYGTDKIGNKLNLLFDQYMTGGTSPEDWAFMKERMPAYRVEMIARTETHGAMSAANNTFFKRTGATMREWWATADDRTRDSHLQAWNRYSEGGTPGPIPFDENFIVGGASMRYPGDKSAPLGEFINCRCVEIPYYPDLED